MRHVAPPHHRAVDADAGWNAVGVRAWFGEYGGSRHGE